MAEKTAGCEQVVRLRSNQVCDRPLTARSVDGHFTTPHHRNSEEQTQVTSRFLLLGAAPDTNNLGVSALLTSAVAAIDKRFPDSEIGVLDNGFGQRPGTVRVATHEREVRLLGARNSKRLNSPDSLYRILLEGYRRNPGNEVVRAVREADIAFDISGGDSFSDIYGWNRFVQVLAHKRLILNQKRPLVLLPQTIGPFSSPLARRLAVNVYRDASTVIARDDWSHEQLRALLGQGFDERRHRRGVDLAFALPSTNPELDEATQRFLDSGRPTAGLNISGLLYNDPDSAGRFGLAANYRNTIRTVLHALLERTDAQVLLVPHVIARPDLIESDPRAITDLVSDLGAEKRVCQAPSPTHASAAKGLIALTDWFSGSRMHATIAALSSGVPAASLAYSDKARGVFESVGSTKDVADLRRLTSAQAADVLVESFEYRNERRDNLLARLPAVQEAAVQQVWDAIEFAEKESQPT